MSFANFLTLRNSNLANFTAQTITGSTVITLSTATTSTINVSTLSGGSLATSTIRFGSTLISLGQSTNQSYNNFSGGSYTTGWISTLSGLNAVKKITMSQNGQYQYAVQSGSSTINTSANSGVSWSALTGSTGLPAGSTAYPQSTASGTPAYASITESATGQYVLAAVSGGLLYTSANYGSTFSALGMGTPTVYLPFENSVTDVMGGTPTATGSPGFVTGVVGSYALNLNNPTVTGTATQYVRQSINLTSTPNFTLSFWFNSQAVPTGQTVLAEIGTSTAEAFTVCITTSGILYVQYQQSSGTWGSTQIAASSSTNTWYQLTIIYTYNGTCSIYLNNTLAVSFPVTFALYVAPNLLSIGTYVYNTNGAYKGYIDDFRFYNSAVTFSPVVPMNWLQTAVSGTGQYQLATSTTGLFLSTNYGATWSLLTSVPSTINSWTGLSMSATGQYMAASGLAPTVYYNFEQNITDSAGGVTSQYTVAGGYYSDLSHPGSYPGSVTYVAGKVGSYGVNTTSGAIAANYYFPMSGFTIAFWLYPISGTIGDAFTLYTGPLTSQGGTIYVGLNPSNQLQVFGAVTTTASSATGTLNAWNHIALTYTPGTLTGYLNGTSALTISVTLSQLQCFLIGQTYPSYTATCYFDDFRIYPSVLSASNIAVLNANVASTLTLVGTTTYYSSTYGSSFTSTTFTGTLLGTSTNGQYILSSSATNYYIVSNYLTGYSSYPSATGTTANTISAAALSSTGQYMVMVTQGTTNNVYYSTNYGASFTALTVGSSAMVSCAMSYDGSYLSVSNASTVYTLNLNSTGYTVAVGSVAGAVNQAQNAIAIGNLAGQTNQSANSIVLNGSGSALNAYEPGLFVNPVANYGSSYSTSFSLLGYGSDSQVVQSNMTVLANGYVGIGTANPLSLLNIYTTTPNQAFISIYGNGSAGNTAGINISPWGANYRPGGTATIIQAIDDGAYSANLLFLTAPQGAPGSNTAIERMRITSSGYVGIGTNNPFSLLQVAGRGQFGYIPNSRGGIFIDNELAYGGSPCIQGITNTFGTNSIAINPVGGSVGIGTTNPASLFNVYQGIGIPSITTSGFFPSQLTLTSNALNLKLGSYYTGGVGEYCAIQSSEYYSSTEHPQSLLLQPLGGYVGIGTNGPSYTLHVNGTISCTNPIFSVTRSGVYSIPNATNTLVPYNSVNFDTNSGWNNSTYQYKPTIAGYYQFSWGVLLDVSSGGGSGEFFAAIYKNGSTYTWGTDIIAASSHYSFSNGSCILYLNGSTDYVQIYVYQNTGAAVNIEPSGGAFPMRFTGYMLRG